MPLFRFSGTCEFKDKSDIVILPPQLKHQAAPEFAAEIMRAILMLLPKLFQGLSFEEVR
jgi:hypothetical protein